MKNILSLPWLRPLSLTQQFVLLSLLILVLSIVLLGWWVGRQIEQGIINRTAAATSLYVYSFLEDDLQELGTYSALSPKAIGVLERMVRKTPYGEQIVRFKVWGKGGVVVYTGNRSQIGQRFPIEDDQAEAWQGKVAAHITPLDKSENAADASRWPRLLEIYTPVRRHVTGEVFAVVEFYQTVQALEQEIAQAKRSSWLVVAAILLGAYLLLTGLVQRASQTIARQQKQMSNQVTQLNTLLSQNQELHSRVQGAATRTTALNERYLRRISAELHDGPAQLLSLALLRLDEVKEQVLSLIPAGKTGGSVSAKNPPLATTLGQMESSLYQALKELREVSAGLRLPELERLDLSQTIERVVRAHQQRSGTGVTLIFNNMVKANSLPIKITTYRLIEEALNNAYQHAGGEGQQVRVGYQQGRLEIEISDQGPGFDSQMDTHGSSLGLMGMRERVESLGGTIEIKSTSEGTMVRARLPLRPEEEEFE